MTKENKIEVALIVLILSSMILAVVGVIVYLI